jgi:hypothetical protein
MMEMEVLMRKYLAPFCLGLTLAVASVPVAAASSSPYPSKLAMQAGLLFSESAHPAPRWGTLLTAAQARWVTIKSSGTSYRWGVWKLDGLVATFPVRSVDGGVTWRVAGPQLATDWAGGSLYDVGKVFPESPNTVVMVSNSVIDVTTDGGRHWYQDMNAADNWSINRHSNDAGISIRIGATKYSSNLPKDSYAVYDLNVASHQWIRVSESLQ